MNAPDLSMPAIVDQLAADRFAPRSTYRLQLHKDFNFDDARAISDYLCDLGIGTVYASPYLAATPGSTHGYDVIDHGHLNPELKPETYDVWIESLKTNGLTQMMDIVPNHMGIASNVNGWWNDVLENGPDAEHGKFFDIAWNSSPRASLRGKVLLPVLGSSYADTLDKRELKLTCDQDKFFVNYYDRRFPIAPKTVPLLLGDARLQDAIDARLNHLNQSPDELDAILSGQFYRLASWRTAADEINYRRFFDVGSLAALAMERPEVFEASHQLILQLLAEGKLQGLRLDHPDGLYDPAEYFDRLQNAFVIAMNGKTLTGPLNQATAARKPLYVLAEKILAMNESLPTEWPIDGTTGYDFLIQVNALFVDTENEQAFTTIYQDLTGESQEMETICRECKLLILDRAMSSELHMLTNQLDAIAQQYRESRDFTAMGLRSALRELIASFNVYRTYITAAPISDRDRAQVTAAVIKAKRNAPHIDASLFDYVESMLLRTGRQTPEAIEEQARFAGKFQQLTSPVTAKGIEDTAFYRYHRLISLNEVGGEPARFGIDPETLHRYLADRQKHWPWALSTLSTHDTKRSEDVRARINVLSEIPAVWRSHVEQWRQALAPLNLPIHPNDEYLLFQTLVGAWPLQQEPDFGQRLHDYMTKALREAKDRTNWNAPNEVYEKTVHALIDAVVDPTRTPDFHKTFVPFFRRISRAGQINSLAQTTLKLFAPGVPDTYQGTELWDFSLVDPDNRRPVDYAQRRTLLRQIAATPPINPDASFDDGRIKMLVAQRALQLRQTSPRLFQNGAYQPLSVRGPQARHVFAFLRRYENEALIVIVPRFLERLRAAGVAEMGETFVELPSDLAGSNWAHVFTGTAVQSGLRLDVGEVLRSFPVAALRLVRC